MAQRLEYIDQLRGIAMILVVIGHIITFCGLGYDNTLMCHIVMMNMPLFFFLNGLVSKDLQWKGLARKIHQLLLPFFVWGALMVLYKDRTYPEFLQHYWKFGYWYLLVLFEFFAVQFALGYVSRLINRNGRLWIDAVIFILAWQGLRFVDRFIPAYVNGYIDYYQVIEYFPFFFLGGFIKRYQLTEKILYYKTSVITILLIILPVLYILWREQMFALVSNVLLPLSIVLLLFIVFCLLEKDEKYLNVHVRKLITAINSLLSTIGRHTLAIYVLQFFFFSYISFEVPFLALYASHNYFAIMLICAIVAILICYACIFCEYVLSKSRILGYVLLGKSWTK